MNMSALKIFQLKILYMRMKKIIGQFPIILVVCYKLNRNKDNQRIEFRKEDKKAKTSNTTYKKKKQLKNSLLNNKKRLLISNLLLISICYFSINNNDR